MDFLLSEQRRSVKTIGKLGKLSNSDFSRIISKIIIDDKNLNKNKCWIWNGTIQDSKKGHCHGSFWYKGRYVQTHRIMYHNFIEDVPEFSSTSLIVLHKCSHENNGKCINPWHLKLGSFSENTKDAIKDKTLNVFKTNEENPFSKLRNEEVLEIISLKNKGLTQTEVAKMYNIHQSQVSRYWNNKTRKLN